MEAPKTIKRMRKGKAVDVDMQIIRWRKFRKQTSALCTEAKPAKAKSIKPVKVEYQWEDSSNE